MFRPAWCLLLAGVLLAGGCGKGQLEVRATGKDGKRRIEVLCEAAAAECMVTVEAIDGERRREIYHQRDDFAVGMVEAAWAKDDAAVDLMICDRGGFPVLLRYDFREARAEVLKRLPESVVGVLLARYGDRPSEVRDRWEIPRWARAEDDLSVFYEYRERIGKARVLVYRAGR